MRNHRQIIREAGHDKIASITERPITTVRSWDQRESIPATAWRVLVDADICTADELMNAAAKDAA